MTEQEYAYCKSRLLSAFAVGGKSLKQEAIITLINFYPEQEIYDLDGELVESNSYKGK